MTYHLTYSEYLPDWYPPLKFSEDFAKSQSHGVVHKHLKVCTNTIYMQKKGNGKASSQLGYLVR
jgi:hypothetical protein